MIVSSRLLVPHKIESSVGMRAGDIGAHVLNPPAFLSMYRQRKVRFASKAKCEGSMLTWRASWWMYVIAAVYALTFLFNTRQEFWGPASEGWVLAGAFKASSVLPGGPMDKAGLRPGDVLEAVGGQPLNGAADWFLARAYFERDHPVELQVRRGRQHLALKLVISAPAWRSWNGADYLPAVWLAFFASFPRRWLSQRSRWALVAVPLVLFGVPIVASAIAMIYAPSVLARPWPEVLSAAPVRLIQDVAGVTPLLFLNELPLYQPSMQARLLELWLVVTILYFAVGGLMLVANYRRLEDPQARRRMGALHLALVVFAVVVAHNFFVRNWTSWFGSTPPALFSWAGFVGETLLFLFIPLI